MRGFALRPFLSMLRPLNLLILLLAQSLAAILLACGQGEWAGLNHGESVLHSPAHWDLYLLMLSTALIFAGGNIINDYCDREADHINKPGQNVVGNVISPRFAFASWLVLSMLGSGLGLWLGMRLGAAWAAWIPLLAALALWWYSTGAQHRFMIGNVVVAGLIFCAIMLPAWMGIWPFASANGELLTFASLAAGASWSREWIKDLQDREGDRLAGSGSAALRLSLAQNRIGIGLTLMAQMLLIPLAIWYWAWMSWGMLLWAAVILLGYALLIIKLFRSQQREDFGRLGTLAKLIMGMGLCWMGVLIWSRCGAA